MLRLLKPCQAVNHQHFYKNALRKIRSLVYNPRYCYCCFIFLPIFIFHLISEYKDFIFRPFTESRLLLPFKSVSPALSLNKVKWFFLKCTTNKSFHFIGNHRPNAKFGLSVWFGREKEKKMYANIGVCVPTSGTHVKNGENEMNCAKMQKKSKRKRKKIHRKKSLWSNF